ncbi:hypothetical protein [Streptomyces stelliscabiei]|uniref:hypothetical protein n=1 Tax=Streptomyces stelliscabiei TaxID=146820 RepID=UPI0029B5B487|nr:hypothetical protein [Streptomyces stelliscabiei]MDX2550163.1 hypothetical protein [Streptomyces stelliscabiei]
MTVTPRLATALTIWHAWMEDSDWWDGNALYLDLDTAKTHAAYDYEGDEYGHPDPDDADDEPRATPEFTWIEAYGSWHLIDHGRDTGIRLAARPVHRPASEREVRQQDALRAVEEAEYAARPKRPLAEELEEAAGLLTTAPAV